MAGIEQAQSPGRGSGARRAVALILAVAMLVGGLAGSLSAGWGYALFLLAGALLAAGVLVAARLFLSRAGDGAKLASSMRELFSVGGWVYVIAVCALAGHYIHETLGGRMEWRWILFGPAILAALIVVERGLWVKLVVRNRPTWARYGPMLTREQAEPEAMRRVLLDEVILHRTLRATSRLRWWRHQLIFWGFAAMVGTEAVAVAVREGFPAFGWPDVWRTPGHPVRLAFDFAYELTGLAVFAGCVLALAWRWRVNGTADQKYSDTPTVVFLLFVVVSGFVVEAMRLAAAPVGPHHWVQPAGALLALALPASAGAGVLHDSLWLVHVLGSCLFIAYIPVKRLVHSCATPVGRLMNSQKKLLAAKKHAILSGLLMRRAPAQSVPTPAAPAQEHHRGSQA